MLSDKVNRIYIKLSQVQWLCAYYLRTSQTKPTNQPKKNKQSKIQNQRENPTCSCSKCSVACCVAVALIYYDFFISFRNVNLTSFI